ncbi:MAG TPA: glycosyltransferase 87 family protein, partial [Vicinamibacteria bacterium]|nr:glycosyltransferase 87 family protein [Vicinamibacteria bacterium]
MVPGLLLLVARDLLLFDPPRVLAWRALHDPRILAAIPSWLLPRPPAGLDRDPLALVLAAGASGLALAYLVAGLSRSAVRTRAALLCLAAVVVVVVPTAGFVAMGGITGRPYGQDGGVVQLPLAMERILSGQSPYAADYSASMLGRQARVSGFWAEQGEGGNPILRHHAYLPGTHLLALPFYAAGQAAGFFDPRFMTLTAWAVMAWLATRLVEGSERRLCAAALVLVNPLVYWHQVFGANDLVPGAVLLASVLLARRERLAAAGALLGLACAVKQLAWPFAPFLLAWWSGARSLPEIASAEALRRAARPALAALVVFVAVVAPVALLDPRAFWADIVVYNAGLGGDSYPLGGTPGFGFANFIVYGGMVSSLRDHVSLLPFYALLVPLGLLLLRAALRAGGPAMALAAGATALLLSLYFSRVVHPNYLALVATLLPLALLMGGVRQADLAVVPLGLLAVAVEVVENEVLRLVWADGVQARLVPHLQGWAAALAPRAGPHLTADPLGLGLAAVAAGIAVAYAVAGVLGASRTLRAVILAAGALAVVFPPLLAAAEAGRASGTPRAQSAWAAGTPGRGRALELFPQSFRRDPARPPDADTWAPVPRLLG